MTSYPRREITLPNPQDQGKVAFVLDQVLTPEECQKLIQLTEQRGYQPALIHGHGTAVLDTSYRRSDRCIIDQASIADLIWARIKDQVPAQFQGCSVVGLNERLRFLKYQGGEYFLPHHDGQYVRKTGPRQGERSYLTLHLYLNEGCQGGSTRFVKEDPNRRTDYEAGEEPPGVDVNPQTGSILIFQHDIFHQGSQVYDGVKYTMRTDIMYRP